MDQLSLEQAAVSRGAVEEQEYSWCAGVCAVSVLCASREPLALLSTGLGGHFSPHSFIPYFKNLRIFFIPTVGGNRRNSVLEASQNIFTTFSSFVKPFFFPSFSFHRFETEAI